MITIEKAIQELTQQVRYYNQIHQVDIIKALNLGVKALERFRNLRDSGKDVGMPLLKGEKRE